jgi:hypothetical protein
MLNSSRDEGMSLKENNNKTELRAHQLIPSNCNIKYSKYTVVVYSNMTFKKKKNRLSTRGLKSIMFSDCVL